MGNNKSLGIRGPFHRPHGLFMQRKLCAEEAVENKMVEE